MVVEVVNMVIELDNQNFAKEVTGSDIPVFLDFWAPWCPPCRMMSPIFEETSKDYEGKVKFAKINTQEHPELGEQFKVSGIPTLILVKNGKEVHRMVGLKQKADLKKELDTILK